MSANKAHTLGKSEARQTRWQSFDKCVASPGQMTTCQFYVYRTELEVPFTITRLLILKLHTFSNAHVKFQALRKVNFDI